MKDIYREMDDLFKGEVPGAVSALIDEYARLQTLLIGRGKEISHLKNIIRKHINPTRLCQCDAAFIGRLEDETHEA